MAFQNPDFAAVLGRIAEAFTERKLDFIVIGGQAVLVHGEPRLTQDIDISVAASPDRLAEVLAGVAAAGLAPLPSDVDGFVRQTFVLPTEDPLSGVRVDVIFASTPYEIEAIGRAHGVRVGDARVPFASADDLILHKLFAGRPRDLEDAAGVVRRQGSELDWPYIHRWAREFSQVEDREGLSDQALRLERGELT